MFVKPVNPFYPGIAAGLPVLVFGVAFILAELMDTQPLQGNSWLLWIADGIVLVGVYFGWKSWWPHWAYAFAGMAGLFSLWWNNATGGSDRILAGPLAWSPLLIVLALSILVTRSLKPFLKLLQGVLRDWSLASLGLYSVLPFAMHTSMSGMPLANSIPFQILAIIFMVAGASIAGWTTRPRMRWRALLLGMSWSWIVITLGFVLYWRGAATDRMGQVISWFDQVLGMSLIWVFLAVIVFFPAGLALLGRLTRQASRNNPLNSDKLG